MNKLKVPGIYHDLEVRLVSKRYLTRKYREKKGSDVLGVYEHLDGIIYLAKDVSPEVLKHNLMHEISHHILDTLESIQDLENQCDTLGAYLLKVKGFEWGS